MAEDVGNIGGLLTPREDYVPRIQSAYGAIIQNAPDYQYFTAPLSNLGNTTATYGGQNNLVVAPDTPIRVVNNATGEVIYSGTGYEGAQAAIDAASALSASAGNKANWDIQVVRPGGQDFESVSTDRPNSRTLGMLADIALPVAASFIPGVGPVLGATLGSTASSVAQGRSLKDTLLRAGLTAATAGLAKGIQGIPSGATDAAISANVNNAINTAYQAAQSGALSALSPIYGAAAGGLAGGAGSLAGSALSSLPSNLAAIDAASQAYLSNAGLNAGSMVGAGLDQFGNVVDDTGAIVVSGGSSSAVPVVAPLAAAAATTAAATSGSSAANAASDAAISQNTQNAVDTAYSNAQTGASDALKAAGYNGMGAGPFVAGGAGAAAGGGVFGTGLSLAQLASITGIGVDLLGKLIGGGGDEGATTPYTSPFGAGPTFAPAARTQINPNIADYEKYGFGPEAMFFSAGQTSPGAATTSGTAGGTTTGGTTTGGTTTGGTTTTTTTPWTAPPGFTGVGPNTKVGDKQVVDGKTYVWGGDGVGWQWQATNNNGEQVLMPGNGATNVSSIDAMMKSGVMRPANEAEMARLAEIDRIMAEASAAETAAEATKINPGTAYFNIDTATADALGDRGLIGDVMSIQQLQQAMAARELTDPNKFATNLFQQIGEQYNKGVLNIDQARAIQQQIQQEQARTGASTQNMQNIFNTAMQQYKPLI